MKLLQFNTNISESLKKVCIHNEHTTNSELQQRIGECLYLINNNNMISVAIDRLTYKEIEIQETEISDKPFDIKKSIISEKLFE